MIDSGTPSTTDPTTMPNGPASSPSPNLDSTIRSLTTKIAAPIKNHNPNCQFPRSELSGIKSNATALIRAPAPKPASAPMNLADGRTQ